MTLYNQPYQLYQLHLKAEMLRARMHRAAAKYGLNDARVLGLSRKLDRVIVEMMRRESEREGVA